MSPVNLTVVLAQRGSARGLGREQRFVLRNAEHRRAVKAVAKASGLLRDDDIDQRTLNAAQMVHLDAVAHGAVIQRLRGVCVGELAECPKRTPGGCRLIEELNLVWHLDRLALLSTTLDLTCQSRVQLQWAS